MRLTTDKALLLLLVAIVVELAGTLSLPRSNGFRDPGWSLVVMCCYAVSAWLLAIVVRTLPVSTTYAVWSGLGTAVVAVIGITWLGEPSGWPKVCGVLLIIAGVVLVNVQRS